MASQMPIPTDQHSAIEAMKCFSDMAYRTSYIGVFDKAIKILYGRDVAVSLDLSKRMIFTCQLCSKDMNAETGLKQHVGSGSHQKNLDRKKRTHRSNSSRHDVKYHHKDPSYGDPNSLRAMLLSSQVRPVGLQMIEEYFERSSGGKAYYKCILCGAHGRLESIYRHTIGNRHTEKYIKSGVAFKSSLLEPRERELIRELLIKKEKITVSSIKTYKDRRLYPYMWEEYNASLRSSSKKKRAAQWASDTIPTPSTSKTNPRSPSPDVTSWESPSSSSSKLPWNEIQQKRPSETSPLSLFRNRSPPPSVDEKSKTTNLHQSSQSREVVKYDQSVQKYDLEELMIQFNFVVKTSHLPEFDIHTQEDVKAVIDMMFKISSALHFITKLKLENSQESSKELLDALCYKKSLLSKIMGRIKLRMEAALLQSEGSQS